MTKSELKDIIKECYSEIKADNKNINEGYKEDYKPGIFGGELKHCVVKDDNNILNTDLKRTIIKIWNTEAKKNIMNLIDANVPNWYADDLEDENGKVDDSLVKKKIKEIQKLALELFDCIAIKQFNDHINVSFWINCYYTNDKANDFFHGHSILTDYNIIGDKFNRRYGPYIVG